MAFVCILHVVVFVFVVVVVRPVYSNTISLILFSLPLALDECQRISR